MKNLLLTFNALMEIASQNPEGFTVNKESLQPVKSGFSVAVSDTQNSFGPQGAAKVVYYANKHNNISALGGWFNTKNNEFYFDAVVICNTLEEAVKLGKENNQIAIFDLNNMQEITL